MFRTNSKKSWNHFEFNERVFYFKLSCLLFIVIVCNGDGGSCPEICQCFSFWTTLRINCANKSIKKISVDINPEVHNLDLSNNQIDTVSFSNYSLKKLRILNLSKNMIYKIFDLVNLNNLEQLNLSNNKIEDFTAVEELSNLRILILSKNPIKQLDHLKNDALTHLIADNCEISYINPTSLTFLTKLTRLSLKYNPLSNIDFPSNTNLRSLDLSHCEISFLNKNAFQNLPNLEYLILKGNPRLGDNRSYLTSIVHNKLQLLDVSQCNLNQFISDELPRLKTLILSRNNIKIFDNTFAKNHEIRFLSLNKNSIRHVDENSFSNMENLQNLDLSYNGISKINKNTFMNNLHLKTLNLSYNILVNIVDLTAFNLTSLDLSHNEMRNEHENQFEQLPQIKHLNLSYNKFDEIPEISSLINLETLNLKSNSIMKINENSLSRLTRLKKIIISENDLKEPFQPEVFDENLNLMTIDLSRNPWHCDCNELKSLYNFLSNVDNASLGKNMCFTPIEMRGYSWYSACITEWTLEPIPKTYLPKTMNFIVISLLILLVLSGSVVSIRHTLKLRRMERHRQANAERAEIRDRLRRLQRRNQQLEEEAISHLSEQRINPLELVGPPSYEEAVDMARLTRSLDTLNSLGTENTPVAQALGSVDNLRSKRRARRPKKKTPSDYSLTKRETRREIRLKRDKEMHNNSSIERANPLATENSIRYSVTSNVLYISSEQLDSSSDTDKRRSPTPVVKRKRRSKLPTVTASTTDDEASEEDIVDRQLGDVAIKNLRFEPKRRNINN